MLAEHRSKTELLGRLNAKGPSLSMAPGGKPVYSMEDIAASLSGLEYPIYCYARVRYAYDGTGYSLMVDETRRKYQMEVRKHRKKWQHSDVMDSVINMALDHMIRPVHCKRCRGYGYLPRKMQNGTYALTEPCPMCKTYSERMPTGTEASECHPDMTPDMWRQRYKERYKFVIGMISEWDGIIESHMKRKLVDKCHTFN